MKGKQIKTLEELEMATKMRKSVIVPSSHSWNKPRPAGFLFMQQGCGLLELFRRGMFIYKKEPKEKKPKPMTWPLGKLVTVNKQKQESEEQNEN